MARANSRSATQRFPSRRSQLAHAHLFGPPALIEGEDSALYYELLARISEFVTPRDIIEEILIVDIVNLQWEVMRYRRFKSEIMKLRKSAAVEHLPDLRYVAEQYFPEQSEEEVRDLFYDWVRQDPATGKKVDEIFAKLGLTRDALMAATLFETIGTIAIIEQWISSAEARRNSALRELGRHRTTLGQATRRAIENIEDARQEKDAA
jgi:hypothetical protein